MRTVFIVLIFGLIALVIGFLPRPLILPDWKTPYEAALTVEDCGTVERIIGILDATDFWQEAFEARFQNQRLGRCDAEPLPEDDQDSKSIYYVDSHGYLHRGYFDERWKLSFLGSRIFLWRGRVKLELSEVVREANNDAGEIMRQCIDKAGTVSGGVPNYYLLTYALKHSELSSERISKIAREQKAQCLRQVLSTLAVMKSAAMTSEDRAAITLYNFSMFIFLKTAPGEEALFAAVFSGLTEEEYKLARSRVLFEEVAPLNLDFFTCDEERFPVMRVKGAQNCALKALKEIEVKGMAGEAALYFALRAKRLGWRDIGVAEDAAKTLLTRDCYDAIVALEAKEADEKTDVRDYEDLDWPIGPGEVCALEARLVE